MKLFKKLFTILLALALIVSTAACDKNPQQSDSTSGGTSSSGSSEPEREETDLMTLTRSLTNSPYTDESLYTKSYGLSDPELVGVDKERFENEVLYPVPEDSEFASNAVITVENATSESLTAALAQAKQLNDAGKPAKVKLPGGELLLPTSHLKKGDHALVLDGYNGLYIDGNGTTLVVESDDREKWVGGITVTNSSNVTIQNINIDYSLEPAFAAKVTKCDVNTRTIELTIDDEFVEKWDNRTINIISYVEYDRYTGAPRANGNYLYLGDIKSCVAKDGKVTVVFNRDITEAPVGTDASIAVTMYGKAALNVTKCKEVRLETINVFAAPCMAYTAVQTENLYYNRANVRIKDGSHQKMTATADAMHIVHCTGDVKITNGLIENTHDDALNIKCGYYMRVKSINYSTDEITVEKIQHDNVLPLPGATMEIYDLDLNSKGTLGVVEAKESGSSFILKVKGNYYSVQAGMFLADISVSPKFVYNNNIVRNKRNRGLLVQVKDGEISNNAFMNIAHGGINLHSEIISGAYETMMPENIRVKNNKFINNSSDLSVFTYGQASGVANPGAIKDIEITNNYFAQSSQYSLSIGSAKDCTISHNYFRNVARAASEKDNKCAVVLDNSANITISNNYNSNDSGDKEFAGVRTKRATDRSTITLENNVAMDYPESTVSHEVVEVKKGGNFTIDGDLSDWEGVGVDLPIVGESLATGVEFKNYKGEFEVRKAKLAWTDDGIYFAADIYDNKLDFKTAANFWTGDCIELFLTDTRFDGADYALVKMQDGANCAQIGLGSWGHAISAGRTTEAFINGSKEWKSRYVQTDYGYIIELFIPFSKAGTLEQSIKDGKDIGFCAVFADADRKEIDRTRLQVGNVGHFVEAKKVKSDEAPLYKFV